MLCPIKVNSNTIELTVHTSSYCILDLLCINIITAGSEYLYDIFFEHSTGHVEKALTWWHSSYYFSLFRFLGNEFLKHGGLSIK